MSRLTRTGIAVLCGVALIWLAQIATALVAATSAFGLLVHWLHHNNLPLWVASPLLLAFAPTVAVSALVGLLVFQLHGRRVLFFACTAAPFVLYSLCLGIGVSFFIGNSLAVSVFDLQLWLSASMAPLGLAIALLVSRTPSEA